ncbi:hypothetical protein L9F63_021354, partial [Diploptera punctata]
AYQPSVHTTQVLHVSGEISSWLDQVKKSGLSERLYVVSKVNSYGPLTMFVRQLRSDPELIHVRRSTCNSNFMRCVFLYDKNAPAFSIHKELYEKQLRCDLVTNIYYNGSWSGLHTLPLKCINLKEEVSIDSLLMSLCSIGDIRIQYFGLNSRRIDFVEEIDEVDKQIGLIEFSGKSSDGKRYMGVACKSEDSAENFSKVKHLTWEIPSCWSLEEAATVPLAYATAYYSLILTANINSGESVLIHAGWTSIGQAAITLALSFGCTVYTTVSNQDQAKFIRQKFPQMQENHIIRLKQCNKEVLLMTKGRGVNIILNTISGKNINDYLQCLSTHSRFVHLARNDLEKNNPLVFLRNVAFFGVSVENLFNIPSEWKKALQSGMQDMINSGVVQPLKYIVHTRKHIQEALKNLFDIHHTGKVLLEASKENSSKCECAVFRCASKNAYFLSGGNAEQCIDVAEWLVMHGARRLVIVTCPKEVPKLVMKRIGVLKFHHNAQIVVMFSSAANSISNATSLLQTASISIGADLSGIIILPAEDSGQENGMTAPTVSHFDEASRDLNDLDFFMCLLSEGSWKTCEARYKEGLPTLAVHWPDCHQKNFNLKQALNVLDTVLTAKRHSPIVVVTEEKISTKRNKDQSLSKLDVFLPSSLEELLEFGQELEIYSSCSMEELSSQSPGYNFVKEVPPVFIIPGLQGSTERILSPLLKNIIYPTFCAKLPSHCKSIPETAAILVQHIRKIQEKGPYNLVGVSCGGPLTLEVAYLLEAQGEQIQIILVDATVETTLGIVEHLKEGAKLEVKVISKLLQINSSKLEQELENLPDLSSRLSFALKELPEDVQKYEIYFKTALSTIVNRILSLLQYQNSNMLLNGEVTLIIPSGDSEVHYGLTK